MELKSDKLLKYCGLRQWSWYSDLLWNGRSSERILVRARFSVHIQTIPGAHPTSCTMGTGSSRAQNGQGVALTNHPNLAQKLKKTYSYTSTYPVSARQVIW